MKQNLLTVVPNKEYQDSLQKCLVVRQYCGEAGVLRVSLVGKKICAAVFEQVDSVQEFPAVDNEANSDALELMVTGTPFQLQVWQATLCIAPGAVTTYQQIAERIGKPQAHRAVANALASNKVAYFIPCHRVLRKDGSLGGYRWGIEIKRALLKAEGAL